jgi:hypothetical protein
MDYQFYLVKSLCCIPIIILRSAFKTIAEAWYTNDRNGFTEGVSLLATANGSGYTAAVVTDIGIAKIVKSITAKMI